MVVSGRLGREIVPLIQKVRQVISIYVYCMDEKGNKEWSRKFAKVKAVVVDLDKLVNRIKADHRIQKNVEESWSLNFFTAGKSLGGVNGKFVYLQVLIDCLLRLKSTQTDKKELIQICKDAYKGSTKSEISLSLEQISKQSAKAASALNQEREELQQEQEEIQQEQKELKQKQEELQREQEELHQEQEEIQQELRRWTKKTSSTQISVQRIQELQKKAVKCNEKIDTFNEKKYQFERKRIRYEQKGYQYERKRIRFEQKRNRFVEQNVKIKEAMEALLAEDALLKEARAEANAEVQVLLAALLAVFINR
ncbi:unnamed protein product [Adineta steineri]|uniref:Uncharacterized protein n=1 Tax=Adineta steineri TaxID=433720 RepID=A0A815Q6T4_9BILA|nr:unnamed protein product [Adineta steineri]